MSHSTSTAPDSAASILALQNLTVEIVSKFEAEFAGGLGDADAYVHVGPFDEGHTIVETAMSEMELLVMS